MTQSPPSAALAACDFIDWPENGRAGIGTKAGCIIDLSIPPQLSFVLTTFLPSPIIFSHPHSKPTLISMAFPPPLSYPQPPPTTTGTPPRSTHSCPTRVAPTCPTAGPSPCTTPRTREAPGPGTCRRGRRQYIKLGHANNLAQLIWWTVLAICWPLLSSHQRCASMLENSY